MGVQSKVVIKKVKVTKKGERVFFQVKLPNDACRIIGVEADACPFTPKETNP